jgi:restriction endonuclease Mrr
MKDFQINESELPDELAKELRGNDGLKLGTLEAIVHEALSIKDKVSLDGMLIFAFNRHGKIYKRSTLRCTLKDIKARGIATSNGRGVWTLTEAGRSMQGRKPPEQKESSGGIFCHYCGEEIDRSDRLARIVWENKEFCSGKHLREFKRELDI